MRMRLGLLQDPAVIDRQIKKEVALAEAARKKAATPTVKTEAETKAEDALTKKEREAIKKKAEERATPRIRPLSEQKAIEMGANFASETFIFAVGIGLILFEQWRQRRKAKTARDDIREDLADIQKELREVKTAFQEYKVNHPDSTSHGLLSFWKGSGKSGEGKLADEKSTEEKQDTTEHTTRALNSTNQPPPPISEDQEEKQSAVQLPKQ